MNTAWGRRTRELRRRISTLVPAAACPPLPGTAFEHAEFRGSVSVRVRYGFAALSSAKVAAPRDVSSGVPFRSRGPFRGESAHFTLNAHARGGLRKSAVSRLSLRRRDCLRPSDTLALELG